MGNLDGNMDVFTTTKFYRMRSVGRFCAKCNKSVEYTEEPMEDRHGKGWNQYCTHCGTIVGMRYEHKERRGAYSSYRSDLRRW